MRGEQVAVFVLKRRDQVSSIPGLIFYAAQRGCGTDQNLSPLSFERLVHKFKFDFLQSLSPGIRESEKDEKEPG